MAERSDFWRDEEGSTVFVEIPNLSDPDGSVCILGFERADIPIEDLGSAWTAAFRDKPA